MLAAGLQLSKSGLFAHFKSKEALQLEVVEEAMARFAQTVVLPAIGAPRGEPRVRALFDGFLTWIDAGERRGGCFFMALAHEFDDRPGAVRDLLVRSQRDWRGAIGKAARLAQDEGHFAVDLDTEQFAYEMVGIGMAYQQAFKLLGDPKARARAQAAFEALVERSHPPRRRTKALARTRERPRARASARGAR